MAQYAFGNAGTTYNVDILSGVTVSADRGFSLDAYGAKGDGSTDDADAFALAHAAAVAAGGGYVYGSAGKTYTIGKGITWDINSVGFDGMDCTINAGELTSGAAITVNGHIEQYNHNRELANFFLIGPGEEEPVIGIHLTEATTNYSAKACIRNVYIRQFGAGVEFGDRSFLNTLFYCQIRNCGIGVNYPAASSNGGENISLYSCTIFNGGIGIVNDDGACDMNLYGCSIDYNDRAIYADGGRVKMFGGHVEWSAAATGLDAPFFVGEGGRIQMYGTWVGAAGTQAYGIPNVVEFDASITDGREGIFQMDGCQLYQLETSSGDFYYGDGLVRMKDNHSYYNIPCDAYINSEMAPWGSFESLDALPNSVYIHTTAQTMTDAHTAGGDTLTLDGTYYYGGSSSLKIDKQGIQTDDFKVGFLVPLARPGQHLAGWRYYMRKPTTGGGDFTAGDASYGVMCDGTYDEFGRPNIVRSALLQSSGFTITNAAMDWFKREYKYSNTVARAPVWATHLLVVIDLHSMIEPNAGSIYVDNFSVSGL